MPIRKLSQWMKKWSAYVDRVDGERNVKRKKHTPRLEELEPRIVLDADWYVVPGSPLEQVSVTFKRTAGSTPYKNELGYYIVADDAGRVEGLLPSDAGYAAAVNRTSKSLFSTSSNAGAISKLTVSGGTKLGFYLVQNNTSTNWKTKNPDNTLAIKPVMFFSFDGANPDGADHVRTATVGSETRYRWEDRTNLADRDFNDMMYSITAERPRTFVPGVQGQLNPTKFTLSSLDADYRNELGIYIADDAKGTINGIAPGQPGFAQAALTSEGSQVLFARGAKKGTTTTVDLPSQRYFGFYLVQNSTTSNFLSTNPENKKVKGKWNVFFSAPTANPDKFNHIRWFSSNSAGFEDIYGGGDKDFNDLVAKFKYGTPYTPSNPGEDHPAISDVLNQITSVGTLVGPIPFAVSDRETPAGQLVVTATSSNPTLLPVGNIVLGGSGGNRFVTLNPAPGLSGISTVTLTVRDSNGLTATDTFTLTVTSGDPNNTPPVISDIVNQTTLVNTTIGPIPFTVSDDQTPADELVITAVSSNPTLIPDGNIIIGGTGNNRFIILNPVGGQTGTVTITITVTDANGSTVTETFTVQLIPENPIQPGNTAPRISTIDNLTVPTNATFTPISFNIDDNETPGNQLIVTASSSNPNLLPASNIILGGNGSNRTVTLNPIAGVNDIVTVTLTVTDAGGLTASESFTLQVTPGTVFPADLSGWTIGERGGSAGKRGSVTLSGNQAVLVEGDSFITTLSRSFIIPANPSPLLFQYTSLAFDTTNPGFINDAFEVALLDSAGNPLTPTIAAGRDAFFNVTDTTQFQSATGVSVFGQSVTLDLSTIPVGTVATLVFRVVNNDADTDSTVTLASTSLPTSSIAEGPVKFFVVDGATSQTHRYGEEGLSSGTFDAAGNTLRGAASNPAGDTVWLIDATTRRVSVFTPSGNQLRSWIATDAVEPQGVTVHNGDLWLVDRGTLTLRRYVGGMARTTDSLATDFFVLEAGNASPSDLVTDGSTIWVTDDALAEVFVYDVTGTLLGRLSLDGDNVSPSGITRNPAGGTDLWVVDRANKVVFHYPEGANARDGLINAAGTFLLGPGNSSPEGIADPPQSGEGYSLLGDNGRAIFDTADDFRDGTMFNVTPIDDLGEIRLNSLDDTEIPPFIWVANSSEGSVSRFNTRTGAEVARYRTGPESLGARLNPSRTTVAGDGSAWVANRSNRDGSTQSSVVHVMLEDFIDRNGNGVMDTSYDANQNGKIDPNEMLPWDADNDGLPDDERIAIAIGVGRDRNNTSTILNNTVARALAIDSNDNIWVGLFNSRQYEVYDSTTGSLLDIVPVAETPYGAVIDANGVLWGATLAGVINRIDTNTYSLLPNVTGVDNYGITVSPDGAVWVAGYYNHLLTRIEPDTLTTTSYAAPGFGNFRGVGVDDNNNVWVASNSPNGIVRFHFDSEMKTLLSTQGVTVNGTATAAVVDADGYAWTTTQNTNLLYKIHPETLQIMPGFPIPSGPEPYNYSDMTGRVRLQVTQRSGTWTEIIDAERSGALWAGVGLEANTPDGTSVVVHVRSSDDATQLPSLAWRTINADTSYSDITGRYLQVEVRLRSSDPQIVPSVRSVTVVSVPAPSLDVFSPLEGSILRADTTVVLDGLAQAAQPEFGPSLPIRNRIISVQVNGQPVEMLDSTGRFYTRVGIQPGENRFTVVALDEYGQSTTVVRTIMSDDRPIGQFDLSQFVDLTATFRAEYAQTSFQAATKALYADIAVRNLGQYLAGVPLYVGVKNISDPAVQVLNAAGTLPDGTPYYDFTGLVTGGATQLAPNAATGTLSLAFSNPNRTRFTYDLVFLGVPNRAPNFTSIPEREATIGREYLYDSNAVDPDGDPLTFSILSGPNGMVIHPHSGVISWTPTASQLGNFPVTVQVGDGRGGSATQDFTVVSATSRPNRPPVFTTLPVVDVNLGEVYTYHADAIDPDFDTLSYTLDEFPTGMTIDSTTGLITWTPTASQLGHAHVTITVNDGQGGTATQSFEVCVEAGNNRPPIIVSEPVTTLRFGEQQVDVIILNDEWTLTNRGFANATDTNQFVRNVAQAFTGGKPGRFLAYDDGYRLQSSYGNPEHETAFGSSSLDQALSNLGIELDISANPLNLNVLQSYDAVLLAGLSLDVSLLQQYITAGGKVLIAGGTGRSGDFGWNSFLESKGLRFANGYNGIAGNISIDSNDRLFTGVSALYQDNGQSIIDLNPQTGGQVLVTTGDNGLYAKASESARADIITVGSNHITPTTALPTAGNFTIDQIADSITGDASPFNGFASPSASGTITLNLDKSYDLNGFILWNDINVLAEGIAHFRLDFFDSGLASLGSTGVFLAPSGQEAPATFNFPTVRNVVRVDLVVLDSNRGTVERIEIREVAFLASTAGPAIYIYDVDTLDPDGGSLSYTLTQAPPGMTIDPTSGIINWDANNSGPNLVINGDFEAGLSGFQTSLVDGPITSAGTYAFGTDPFLVYGGANPSVGSYGDHTSGTGLMFMSNGATDHNLVNWEETIPIEPNTNYVLSAWGATLFDVAPSQLRFVINGITVGDPFDLPLVEGVWQQFNTIWNSGNATSATIQIFDNTEIAFGNDFTLDDISFKEDNKASQSFPVTVRVDDGRGGSDTQSFIVNVVGDVGGRGFDPIVEWHKNEFTILPDYKQVAMTPAVIDLNNDAIPDIVFVASNNTAGSTTPNGVLRAISGKDGQELWTVSDPTYRLTDFGGVAVGDIDQDGQPEIVAIDGSGKLVAFEHDGSPKWRTEFVIAGNNALGGVGLGSPSLADLDGDGTPEIILGSVVVNADGSLRWDGTTMTGTGRADNGFGPLSAVADLNGDGTPEVVAGNTAFLADGSVLWTENVQDGFPAVGNFDADSGPEIVLVAAGFVYLLDSNGTVIWGPQAIPGGGNGGAPTIADFDNDGLPEIGVAGASRYVVFETDGSVRWQSPTQDESSHVTGSSVFDFDGDGSAEVVYGDEAFLRIFNGSDGTVLYQLPKSSATGYEYPVVADVDGDGNAEIIAVANTTAGFGPHSGIYVIGDRNNTWVNARQIWNQHTYHITNVNDDGTIPTNEVNNWEVYNNYRANVLTSGVDPRSAPDLLFRGISQTTAANGDVTFTATVLNDGSPVEPGVSVAFFDGNPAKGGRLLGTLLTTQQLSQGQSDAVSFTVPPASVNDLWVRVDDDGTGIGSVPEYDETNNAFRAGIDLDPINYAPKQTRQFTTTETTSSIRTPYKFTLPVLDPDGDDITYELIAGPDGLMVHESLGVVAWYPLRDQVGDHQVIISATDTFGNATLLPFTLTVATPNTAPTFTSYPPTAAAVDRLFEYHAFAQDAEQTDLAFSLVNPQPGMSISSDGLFTWTPTNSTPASVTIRVSDGKLTNDQVFDLNVAASSGNTDPTLIVEAPSLAWLGRTYVARLLGSDSEADPVRYALMNGPVGMTVDAVTGILTWTPTATGSETIRVKAIDGQGGETEAEFNVTITSEAGSNRAPVIISNPPHTAQTGVVYVYDLVAHDPDGGPVVWSLVSGPQGMSLDSERGTLRWTPAEDQTGSYSVTVRATDQMLAIGEQTFTINVSCSNAPPAITSRPPTIAYVNEQYIYAVRATDPEGDPLTFELTSAPDGMFFVPGTSLIRYAPTLTQAGSHDVVIRVTDLAGNVTTQAFTLVVSTETPNRAPVITSRSVLGATIGREYVYTVAARDPDGDALSYALTSAPSGMIIDASGRISWTPSSPAQTSVTIKVADTRGGVAVQTYTITARANQAPIVETIPNASVALQGTFRAVVRATDPEGDALTFALLQAPPGMTIDNEGRIIWTPTGEPRIETIKVQVADTAGLAATTQFTLTVIADTEAPKVTIQLSQTFVNQGTPVQIQVRATDNIGIGSLQLTVTQNGITTDVALNASGIATFTPANKGRYTFTALATDTTGNTATTTTELSAFDPNATSDVRSSFTRLEMLTAPGVYKTFAPTVNAEDVPPELSYLTDVYGTVTSLGQPLAYWQLLMAPASEVDILNPDLESSVWKELSRGTTTLTDAKLGTFDPTLLQNDGYVLALVAYDVTGSGWVQPTVVSVIGNAKLGDFRLEFTDLSLPLNGIPITITRMYDTKAANTSGAFGYGWSLGVRDTKIRETVPSGPGSGLFSNGQPFVSGRTKVYLTNPSGQRVGFTYTEEFHSGGIFTVNYKPVWVPDPGVTDKLATDGLITRGMFGVFDYNPDIYHLTTTDGTTYEFDQTIGLKKISDTNGNTVTFTANAITHSGGRVITLERDGAGRITTIRLPDGSVAVRYRYSAAGDLIEVKQVTKTAPVEQALTSTISYRTDRAHYLDEYIDANGNRAVKTVYDASGRLVGVTDANGNTASQQFDLTNFTETVSDALGNPRQITYNERGNVVRTEQPTEFGAIVMQYEYADTMNNPDKETKIINGRGFVTARAFDVAGNLLSETTPDGTTSYLYNSLNKLKQVTDTMGRVTAYGYDVVGNLIGVATPNGEASSFTYDDQGRVKTLIDFKGNVTQFTDYCACGRPLTIINPDGSIRTSQSNQYSQVTMSVDERGFVTQNEYDNQGRLITLKTYLTSGGTPQVTRYEYTGTNQTKVIDPLGNVTRYEYDKLNRRTRIIDAEGGITSFEYDANGNQETVTDPVGNVTSFEYDKANRVKEEIDPLGKSKFFKYDAAGNKTEITDRMGRVRQFEYDPMNRQTLERWLGTDGLTVRIITSQYDVAGNMLSTADPDAVLTYKYDSMNRMVTATTVYPGTNVAPVTLFYGYDSNGNIISVKDNTGVEVASTYDSRNRLETRIWSGGDVDAASVKYTYFANSQVKTLTRYADTTQTNKIGSSSYDYWDNGLTKKITHFNGTGAVLVNYDYLYNNAGLLRQETHHGKTYVYGYDKTGQLLTSTINGTLSESFSYDKNGNRLTSTGPNGNQTYAPSLPGEGNQLKNDGKYSYKYDAEGNLSEKTELATGNVTRYTWDHRNRLTMVEERSSGGVILSVNEYAYDPTGRRILQKVNGKELYTAYDRDHAWVDVKGDGSVSARYVFGDWIDDILARWQPEDGSAWYLKDKLGTVRELVSSVGIVINTADYSAFGIMISSVNIESIGRYMYTGRETTYNLDMYYRTRTYNSHAGRFLNRDTIGFEGLDYNMYRYVGNAPVIANDPTGMLALPEYALIFVATLDVMLLIRGVTKPETTLCAFLDAFTVTSGFVAYPLAMSIVIPLTIAAFALDYTYDNIYGSHFYDDIIKWIEDNLCTL